MSFEDVFKMEYRISQQFMVIIFSYILYSFVLLTLNCVELNFDSKLSSWSVNKLFFSL